MKQTYLIIAATLLIFSCSSENSSGDQNVATNPSPEQTDAYTGGQDAVTDDESAANILQVAAGSADHSTLVAAVQAAELTTVLANNGPLTVFAPVNSAFDALPEGTVDNLLKPENKSQLAEIITFHAAPGTYDVPDLKDGQTLFVATGHNLKVEVKDDGTYVHGAKILGTVPATNGIIHVVDKVLLPE